MDLNIVVLAGKLAVEPEFRNFESGARLARLLVTVRSENPTVRTDVVPVTLWDPDGKLADLERGDSVCVTGTLQRRFWTDGSGKRSRVEVIAHQVVQPDLAPV